MVKKIGDIPKPCMHPAHNPPKHIVLEEGVYEHICPSCKARQVFTVHRPVWSCGRDICPPTNDCMICR